MKNRIEEIRKSKGIRQEDFAKALSVSRQTISSLETGRYNPSIFLAHNIARIFEMSIEDVFILVCIFVFGRILLCSIFEDVLF